FDRNLDHAEAAFQQIVSGDLLVINKADTVAAEIPGLIENGVRKVNPDARFITAVRCDIPLDIVFGIGGRAASSTHHDHEDDHNHDRAHHHSHDEFDSVSLSLDRVIDPERFT